MPDSHQTVNYDLIAPTYDDRYRMNRLGGVENGLLSCVQKVQAVRVLEAGCGTGRWLRSISSAVQEVYGLDLSPGMLAQAQKGIPNHRFTVGRASDLPYADTSFDVVFCVNALHHFRDPQTFISVGWDVLNTNGCLAIIGQVPQDHRNQWYVYHYFEGTYETDLKRFHSWETVKGWMELVGFEDIHLCVVETIRNQKIGRDILQDHFLKKNAVSQLAILSDQAYQQGIERIEGAIKAAEEVGSRLVFQTEIILEMITGRKRTQGY